MMGDGLKRAFAAAKKTRTDPTMPKIMPPAVEIAMAKALGYSPSCVVGNPHGLRHVWAAIREALMKEGRE